MPKILITGAAGYIGRHAVNAFQKAGWDVLAADSKPMAWSEGVTTVQSDIFSEGTQLYEKLGRPDACLHLAWRDGFQHNLPSHIDSIPQQFAFIKNLVDAQIPKLAVMGTMHEIGYWEGAITETTPCTPLSFYGVAKNTLRQATLLYGTGKKTDIYWLRGYYLTGDDKNNHSVFAKILQMEEQGVPEFPFNSGKNQYDFIDIDEMTALIPRLMQQNKVTGVINVCSGRPVPLAEKVNAFLAQNHCRIRLKYGAFPDRPYDSPAVWGDVAKLQAALKVTQI